MHNNKKLIVLILTLILTIAIIAASSYAFFDLVVNNDNHVTSNITTKDLSLKFTDGPKVELTDVLPGATIIKTFSVENTGTETLYYTIYLNDVINSFTRNSDLVYTLTSTNDGAVLDETELPKTSKALYQNIEIPVNTTQDYTLTITYKNLNEDQNADMGKMFSGTIQLVAGVKTYNLTGYAYDNNGDLMNSGTVEVHSDVITAPIQSNGSFTLVNVPVGDHEILIKDNEETVVAEDTFKLDTKAIDNTITNNDIKAKEEDKTLTISVNNKASDNVEIKILGNLNTVDLTINNGYSSSPVLTAYDGQKTNVVTINPEEHYHFKNITCDNNIEYTLSGNQLYVNSLTTSGTCTINYEIDTVNVELVVNNGTGADSKTIAYNTSTTFTSAPNTGYKYESISCTNGMNASYSGTTVTTGSITNNTVCTLTYVSTCAYSNNQQWNYSYNGEIQSFTVPCAGTYKLEVWGASGGGLSGSNGLGGYSQGTIRIDETTPIYIGVGQEGRIGSAYNGGGSPSGSGASGGGGATHIATTNRGVLSNYASYSSEVLIVAGGGGGRSGYGNAGGAGGGTSGIAGTGYFKGYGGTQTAGGTAANITGTKGSFGKGGNGESNPKSGSAHGGGAGGGYYGGGGGGWSYEQKSSAGGGGGGSGYIGGVENGETIAGNQTMPNPSGGTMTGKSGNGYARITLITASS